MPNFISEDEIEAAMLQRLQLTHGYDVQDCFTTDPANLNDGSGRTDKREVILHDRLRAAVIVFPRLLSRMPSSGCATSARLCRPSPPTAKWIA